MTTAVSLVALVLAAGALAGCLVIGREVRTLRRRAADLDARVAALLPAPPLPPNLAALFGSGSRRIIAVEILNPVEVATSQVKVAGLLGAVRPSLLNKIVYDQATTQVIDQLADHGVLADVQVHVAR